MRIALVAIAKDEDDYIWEWILYHKMIGFTDIFIYLNNWNWTPPYKIEGVNYIHWDEPHPQIKIYNEFIDKYYETFDFAAFFDIDEFLCIRNSQSLRELMFFYRDVNCIFVNWRYFGDSGKKFDGKDYNVITRFTKSSLKLDPLGKNILNLNLSKNTLHFHDPHWIVKSGTSTAIKGADPNKKKFISPGDINESQEILELFHYRNKTWDEYCKRKYKKSDVFWKDGNTIYNDLGKMQNEYKSKNFNDIENPQLSKFGTSLKRFNSCLKYVAKCNDVLPQKCRSLDFVLHDYRYGNDSSEMIQFLSKFRDVHDMSNILYETCMENSNFHHWTPSYVWSSFIPLVLFKLGIDVDLSKFDIVDGDPNLNIFPFHEYRNGQTIYAKDFTTGKEYSSKDPRSILRVLKNEDVRDKTNYHRLFRFSHDSVILKNDKPIIDKKLFISCDSMAIPVAPIMFYIFREVLVRDYRFGIPFSQKIKEFDPDFHFSLYLTNDYRDDLSIEKAFE